MVQSPLLLITKYYYLLLIDVAKLIINVSGSQGNNLPSKVVRRYTEVIYFRVRFHLMLRVLLVVSFDPESPCIATTLSTV